MYTKSLLKGALLGIGLAFAGAAYAGDYSCPPASAENGNNGWGQEKHGGSNGTNAEVTMVMPSRLQPRRPAPNVSEQ